MFQTFENYELRFYECSMCECEFQRSKTLLSLKYHAPGPCQCSQRVRTPVPKCITRSMISIATLLPLLSTKKKRINATNPTHPRGSIGFNRHQYGAESMLWHEPWTIQRTWESEVNFLFICFLGNIFGSSLAKVQRKKPGSRTS